MSGRGGSRAAPPKKRLSLVERQQQLLEEQGFSQPPAARVGGSAAGRARGRGGGGHYGSSRGGFFARQDAHLQRQPGMANAAASSRRRAPMPMEGEYDEDAGWEGGDDSGSVSVASHMTSGSLHPSLAGSTISLACSEVTIGAGDDTNYWDFQHREVTAKDLGHTCRECRQPFRFIGDPLTERRGARIASRYHAECFSGFADPRSQAQSSHHTGRLAGTQIDAAPALKATSKMRTGAHFDGGGRSIGGGGAGMGGKHGAAMGMGSLGFGANSSKGQQQHGGAAVPAPAPGGFTAVQLEAHRREAEAGGSTGAGARVAVGPRLPATCGAVDLENERVVAGGRRQQRKVALESFLQESAAAATTTTNDGGDDASS